MAQRAPDADDYAALMGAVLQAPLQATHAQLLPMVAAGRGVEWLGEDSAALPADAASGWLFRLEREHLPGAALFVASARKGRASDPSVQTAALLCRLAWRLRDGQDSARILDPLAESIHALRNGLNAGLMNSAMLAAHKADVAPTLLPTLERVEHAAERSAQALHRLVAVLEHSPRWVAAADP